MGNSILKPLKFVFVLCLLVVIGLLIAGRRGWVGPALIATFASAALYCMSHPVLKSFAFTVWVFAFVAASMVYPVAFMTWAGFDLKILIVPLIQIIMFGMGTTLSLADFTRVIQDALAGVRRHRCCNFRSCPLVGFCVLAERVRFPAGESRPACGPHRLLPRRRRLQPDGLSCQAAMWRCP